jgi:hypothetical protein
MIERRGFLGALLAGVAFVGARVLPSRGRLVPVWIVWNRKYPFGVMALHAQTGMPVSGVKASDEQVAAIKALRIGDECSVQAFLRDTQGEMYLAPNRQEGATEWLRLRRVA